MTKTKGIKEDLILSMNLGRFLCDRKYDVQCDKDIGCTFDYIKSIKWFFEIEE